MEADIYESTKNFSRTELLSANEKLHGDLLTVARRLSHDLRTPLGGIITSGEALKEMLAASDPAALAMVTSSLDSAEELNQLIQRASFVLKATAAPLPLEMTSMEECVTAALQRSERRVLARNASIVQPNSWPQINGVQPWLETVWLNLLINALQHAKATPLKIEMGCDLENDKHKFWVSDNGAGVPENRRKKLFYPFERLHEPEAAPGLGLSIVRRLVELQGGDCGYEVNSMGGACFYFLLP